MASKIGFRRIARTLGNLLQIEDVTRSPSRLATDDVLAVVDFPQFGHGPAEFIEPTNFIPLQGLSQVNEVIVGPVGTVATGQNERAGGAVNDDLNGRLLAADATVLFDAAGAAAAAADGMRFRVLYEYLSANPLTPSLRFQLSQSSNCEVKSDVLTYPFCLFGCIAGSEQFSIADANQPRQSISQMPIGWPAYVPAGRRLQIRVTVVNSAALGNFPANTELEWNALLSTVPRGGFPPL